MEIRRYLPGEEAEIRDLFVNTIRFVNARDYTPAQIDRWARRGGDQSEWMTRLQRTNPFVAVENGEVVGFAELEPDGHIDRFYCRHDRQRQGVGRILFRAVEAEGGVLGVAELYAEVSVTAEPLFTAMGFGIAGERSPIVCGSPGRPGSNS